MECDRFIRLVKTWYVQVQDEALAPARMVALMKQHVIDCRVCQNDPGVGPEVEKITEIVLPPSKAKLLLAAKVEPDTAEEEIEGAELVEEVEEESGIPDEEEGLDEEEEEI
jgi:hypothetical protein